MRNGWSFLRLWAVAAVTVAGVCGAVWAQGSALNATPFSTSKASLPSATIGAMPIGITVEAKNTTVTYSPVGPSGLANTGTTLETYDVATGTANGNTGTIKVETEYVNWDIELKTANSGILRLNGAATGAALRKTRAAGGAFDTAKVGIQLAIKDNDGGNFWAYTPISTTWVNSSKTTAIAFSKVLSIGANTGVSDTYLKSFLSEDEDRPLADETDPKSVSKNGFGAPCKSGGASGCDGSITFAVNTGLGLNPAGGVKLVGNAPGTYTDTLKFTMIASY